MSANDSKNRGAIALPTRKQSLRQEEWTQPSTSGNRECSDLGPDLLPSIADSQPLLAMQVVSKGNKVGDYFMEDHVGRAVSKLDVQYWGAAALETRITSNLDGHGV